MHRYHVCMLALWSVVALGVAAPAARAGSKKAKVEFTYRVAPTAPEIKVSASPIYLRPNTEQSVDLFVRNVETDKEEDALKDVALRLVRVDGDTETVIAAAKLDKVDKLPPGAQARLVFIGDKALPWIGMRPKLQLWLDAKNKDTVKQDLRIVFEHPSKYVDIEEASYNRTTNRLSFLVSLKKNFVGPPCKVVLMIDRDYVPGLKALKRTTLEQDLKKIGQALELAADIEFDGALGPPNDARVFLNVDGFDRAFEFLPNFNDVAGVVRAADYTNDVAVRFRTNRYILPDKKKPLELNLEIDARQIDQPAWVEFGFNRSEDNTEDAKFDVELKPGLSDMKLSLNAAKDGALLCKMVVVDWRVKEETAEMLGRRWMRVRVLDENGKTEKAISKTALRPLEIARGNLAPLELKANRVWTAILLDDTPVQDVRFKLEPTWPAGKTLDVMVTTKDRPENRYAPIEKAIFYIGKKSIGKIEAEEQQEGRQTGDVWTAKLATPEKEGKIEVAVQFQLRNGMVSAASEFVILRAVKPGEILTTLKGKVMDVAQRPFPGVAVQLKDAKGAVKAEQKANDKGLYAFEKLTPGDYVLEAKQAIPPLRAREAVAIPPGKEVVEKDLQLKMK